MQANKADDLKMRIVKEYRDILVFDQYLVSSPY